MHEGVFSVSPASIVTVFWFGMLNVVKCSEIKALCLFSVVCHQTCSVSYEDDVFFVLFFYMKYLMI